jgi:hypothetical protein
MADEEHTGSCAVCQRRTPTPEDEPVCAPCRSRVAGQLRDVPALVEELRGGGFVERDARHRVKEDDHGRRLITEWPADPVAHHLTAGPISGQSNAPRVQGSREAPVPIRVDVVDLLAEADERTVHDSRLAPIVQPLGEPGWVAARLPGRDDGEAVWQEVRTRELVRDEKTFRCRCGRPELHANQPARPVMAPAQDQTGHVSVATVLHAWCRDFAETRHESEPDPAPAAQCRYLLDRLDWAFSQHPAVDEFAGELGDLWHVLRRAAGLTMPRPELVVGVPCKSIDCDLKTLWRLPGSDYVECASCGRLYTMDDYQAWVALVAAAAKGSR